MADDRPFMGAKWAQFRFGVIGALLVSPPKPGELQERIEELAQKRWLPPGQRDPVALGFSTIERWYYQALGEAVDPIRVLQRRVRCDPGVARSLSESLRQAVLEQYAAHRRWSYQLHYDNLVALVAKRPELGPLSSYATVRRSMKRLYAQRDVVVGALTRPQGSVPDLYQELGHLFSVPLTPHNRWSCAKVLRVRWVARIDSAHWRPLLLIDEAQEMRAAAINELRFLMSKDLDACSLLTVVLAGEQGHLV